MEYETHEEKRHDVHEHHESHTHKKEDMTEKLRTNPWIMSTFVLGILVVVLIFSSVAGGISGKTISEDKAAELVLGFVESQGVAAELVEVDEIGNFYEITFLVQGQMSSLSVTKDGEYLTQGVLPLSLLEQEPPTQSEPTAQGIVKSDVPEVELVITSYCPYGLQAAKGMLPVAELLGDKMDFKIKYFNIPSHGEKEELEGKRQICIREQQPDKFLDYASCFVGSGDFETCLTSTAIDRTKLDNCMENDIQNYYSGTSEIDVNVGSSPTLIINGAQVQSARDSASYLDTICQSFTDENVPEACGTELSSASPTSGFGWDETSASTSAQC